MNIENKLRECIENCGVFINKDGIIDIESLDSVDVISTFIEIENEFSIQIPDEKLLIETLSSLKSLSLLIEEIINRKE